MANDSNLLGVQYREAQKKGLKKGDEGYPEFPKMRPHSEKHKERISAGKVIHHLQKLMEESSSETVQLGAASKLLDKVVPTLSSVDSTLKDTTEKMTEEQLVAKLRSLIKENPTLMSKVLGDNARGGGGIHEAGRSADQDKTGTDD